MDVGNMKLQRKKSHQSFIFKYVVSYQRVDEDTINYKQAHIRATSLLSSRKLPLESPKKTIYS
jgi:hypothetical protein